MQEVGRPAAATTAIHYRHHRRYSFLCFSLPRKNCVQTISLTTVLWGKCDVTAITDSWDVITKEECIIFMHIFQDEWETRAKPKWKGSSHCNYEYIRLIHSMQQQSFFCIHLKMQISQAFCAHVNGCKSLLIAKI